MSEQRVANDVTKYVHFEVRVPNESQPTLVGEPVEWQVDGYFRRHEDAIERQASLENNGIRAEIWKVTP